ncbi:MAG: hypothetical protein OES32_10790 [Acidobacteriota bacterium]|nr:hypothetical protein [Acidobacteriota bacterium]MDH3524062.1 hypothetical protein [Acidobacteriota bacterium]
MTLLLLTLGLFALVMLVMSVGVIVSGRCLRGSCGGPAILDGSGEPVTCAACPNRERLIAEARQRAASAPDGAAL